MTLHIEESEHESTDIPIPTIRSTEITFPVFTHLHSSGTPQETRTVDTELEPGFAE